MLAGASIRVEDGLIRAVSADGAVDPAGTVVDAGGAYVAPGFIDMHVHGGGGFDFMDLSERGFIEAAVVHARHGTTSLVPTTVACGFEKLRAFIAAFESVAGGRRYPGADLVGMHLEGPYVAVGQKGALDERFIKAPDPREYEPIIAMTDHILRWDAAPELPGSGAFGDRLLRAGILPSVAHSDATFEEAVASLEHGFTHITHFYSGTSTVTRAGAFRRAGVVEFGYLRDDVTVEVIADGCHLPASLLQLVFKIKGPSRIALVTDAMRAAGTDLRTCRIGSADGGLEVIIEDGVAKMPDRTCFAGSVATTDRLVRNMVRLAGAPLASAVQMATITPARILGIDGRKGMIAPGRDADLVLFDQDINIRMTMVRGEVVFDAAASAR
jgi:N-acetylglucosamine-6-phosphate deacetylase